jgi:hypothetical protein
MKVYWPVLEFLTLDDSSIRATSVRFMAISTMRAQ